LSLQYERTVNRDNTVNFQNLVLQIEPVAWRATLAGCSVIVHQHLDGTITLTHEPQRLGHYTCNGVALEATQTAAREKLWKRRELEKSQNRTLPPRLEIPPTTRDSHFPTASAAAGD